ncbi:hypothetical protein [uncultured Roseobacter sp.]|uniref:hypothetical protein n=1 Tax=uncultured Roseobacter sp. TaxID=114847 RepID=UPI00260FD161|nr:hypothetical protein [uncultured Roseobacter sp.]
MKITARCHPALRPLLPDPVPAARGLPGWLREMPEAAVSEVLGGEQIRTLKHCAPMIDALRLGVLILNPVDLVVSDGEVHWEWDPPPAPETLISRAPVGVHVPEQAEGSPFAAETLIVKFINYWTLRTEPGWSLLVMHPVGHPDLPFRTLPGVVDTDLFGDGYIHFPSQLDAAFEGVIERGTPVAQVIPVQKDVALEVGEMSAAEVSASTDLQETLAAAPGTYRKEYRR